MQLYVASDHSLCSRCVPPMISDMRTTPARYFIVCGFLDFVGNLLVTIPAPFVPGPVQVRDCYLIVGIRLHYLIVT